ncbi:unnamed protein product [Soboliphyme baturini]|uniref:Brix domain-containing protein n=1 Tax=Soboliphyme baturini TaxID=241478 RepID=A0A3P8BI15_9BILA|nr:unnamed protein product [Soboliphyme baturini]
MQCCFAQHTSTVEEPESLKKAPHSFIFYRGKVGPFVRELVTNLRLVFEPYTASKLKPTKKNVLKDFVSVAGPLGVTHFMVFSRTELGLNMRLIRLPRGPTLTFRVHEYTINRDIVSSLKRPHVNRKLYLHFPLMIINGMKSSEEHLKLTQIAFQHMLPSINVNTVKLKNIRRCVLLTYDKETKMIQFRHYAIKVVPTGVSKSAKKLLRRKVPDLGRYKDISDYFIKPENLSESEYEGDGAADEVELPQNILIECGPRMKLELLKIEDGMCDGSVLYHAYIKKTPEEIAEIEERRAKKKKLKEQRRIEQELNVKRKQEIKKVHFAETAVKAE